MIPAASLPQQLLSDASIVVPVITAAVLGALIAGE